VNSRHINTVACCDLRENSYVMKHQREVEANLNPVLHVALCGTRLRLPTKIYAEPRLNEFSVFMYVGRITNRLSKDVDTADIMIPITLRTWLITMAICLQTIILIIIADQMLLIILVPVLVLFVFIQRFYICTSRQLKRVDSVLRSPIFAHFQASLLGTTAIRAYKITDRSEKSPSGY
jgi:ABC-type multidrug transport system fused ATPase/permease subunit